MKHKLLISLSLLVQISFGQLQNNTWYFSPTNKGIQFDFATDVPSVITGHAALTSLHGCSVASSPATGSVLFYTDGQYVYDAGNFQMPNGSGLLGGVSCAMKGDIVQVPDSCYKYYVFSNNANSPAQGSIYYSIVDMKLPGNGTVSLPKGDVETATLNTLIMDTSTESYTVVQNIPGDNFWLIAPVNNSSIIKVFSITSTGVTYANSFNTGRVFNSSMSIKYSASAGKVAYVSVVESDPALIMDFNSITGILSNATIISGTPVGPCTDIYHGWHDLEFSPDGTKLYLSKYRMYSPGSAGRIYQYDLNSPLSPVTVVFDDLASTDIQKTVTGLQAGPDGKIYFIYFNTTTNDDRIIGAINNPDSLGVACNVNATALDLGIAQSGNSRFSKSTLFNHITKDNTCENSAAGIIEISEANNISIYPNPASDQLTINLSKLTGIIKFEIFDGLGKLVYQNNLNQLSNTISLKGIESGVYYCKFSDKENYTYKKLIITEIK